MNDTANSTAIHHDSGRFVQALQHTSRVTDFSPRLIEKDYYCTLALEYLYIQGSQDGQEKNPLVFIGGTCLSKIHTDFYRLSEDLDFHIPIDASAPRSRRRAAMTATKVLFNSLPERLPCFQMANEQLTGHNESKQYKGTLLYESVVTPVPGEIHIDIGLREQVLASTQRLPVKTLLQLPEGGQCHATPGGCGYDVAGRDLRGKGQGSHDQARTRNS